MPNRWSHSRTRTKQPQQPPPPGLVVVSDTLLNTAPIQWPLHAVRLPPSPVTSGWAFWTGEPSANPAKFAACHAEHLVEKCPELAEHLDRPPGTRLVIAPGYQGIWFDEAVLADGEPGDADDLDDLDDEYDYLDEWEDDDEDDDPQTDDAQTDEIVPAATP